MKWTLSYIPILGKHDADYMEIPTPILIGINSNIISVEEAMRADQDATILDIDSNILYTSEKPLFCDCVKSRISKKIQLAKAYYYVSRNRLNTFRMHSLEQNLEDEQYVHTARRLLTIPEGQERDEVFVSLIRHAFFKEFAFGIGKFADYLSYKSMKREYEIQKDLFLHNVKTCERCTMKEFWKNFLDSVTFMQFLDYYGKFDESLQERFIRILNDIENKSYEIYTNSSCYQLDLASEVTPLDLYTQIEGFINTYEANTSSEKFIRCSALEMLETIKSKLKMNEKLTSRGNQSHRKRSMSLMIGNSPMSNLEMNFTDVYYGEFGIIQVLEALMTPLTRAQFRMTGSSEKQLYEKLDHSKGNLQWQPLVLKFLFDLRKNKKNWDHTKLLENCYILNATDMSKLPKRHTVNIIEVAYNKNPNDVYELINLSGELKNLAEAYKQSREEMSGSMVDSGSFLDKAGSDFSSFRASEYKESDYSSLLRSRSNDKERTEERKDLDSGKRKR